MKIGIDIRVLMDKQYSGISEYTANLLSVILRRNEDAVAPDDYVLFYNSFHDLSSRLDKWSGAHARVIATRWPNKIFNYLLQKTLAWPKIDKVLGGVDLFWSPHFNFTRLSSAPIGPKKIITVHDLSFLRYPEFFSGRKNFWHRALSIKKTLRAADKIIAISENTKNDLIELIGIAPEKIKVIYSGNNYSVKINNSAEDRKNNGTVVEEIKDDIKNKIKDEIRDIADGRFILYLGNIEPRKNVDGLIKAYDRLRSDDRSGRFKDLKLVIAGAKAWKNRAAYLAQKKSSYCNDIKFLGYVSQKDKEILMASAVVFCYPSFYEGFGFPPLEAMSAGTPVVCSNVSSLPEVVGDAALTVNPFKIEEIVEALRLVLSDEKLRQKLIERGHRQAALFSWDKAAGEYLELFQKLK
ncbi:MAG: glycosyltransferase family 1 protein [Patescibacteria group bacterium]